MVASVPSGQSSHFGLEDYRQFLRLEVFGIEALNGALRRFFAHAFAIFEQVRDSRHAVPVIAFHPLTGTGDDGTAVAMPRCQVIRHEAQAVGIEALAGVTVDIGAFGIGNARVILARHGFTFGSQLDGLFGRQ